MNVKCRPVVNAELPARNSTHNQSHLAARLWLFALAFAVLGLVPAHAGKAVFAPPTNLSATSVSSNSVTLSWTDNSTNEKYEIVSRSLQPTSGFSDVASLTANTTTYTDRSVAPSTTYYYQVSAARKGGQRASSSVIGVTTLAAPTASAYTISTSSSPTTGGTTSGGGTYPSGSTVTVTATPSSTNDFSNWTENGSVVSTSSSYTFTATGNRSLVANFVPDPKITTMASPSIAGTTSGGGNYHNGATVTVTATVTNSCYTFSNWTVNGTVVSTSASYSFTATSSQTLVANFSQINYTITTSSSPSAGGSTSGGGTKTCGSSVTVTATANSGYNFANWTEGGSVVSSSSSYSFTASANRTLVANFSTVPSYTISTSSSPTAGGSTSGGGSYTSGSTVTVTATANSCYSFVNWTENGSEVSTSSSYSFTASANRTLVANFSQISYTITTSSSPSGGGSTSGGGTKTCGSSFTLTASANSGYNFVNWTQNGTVMSTSSTFTFTPTSSATLVANFTTAPNYTVTTTPSPSAGGSTSGGGTYSSGSTASVSANANSGYNFANWTENGTIQSTSPTYSFTVTANRNLVANFTTASSGPWAIDIGSAGADIPYSVTADSSGNVFVAGYFNGTVSFGGVNLTSIGSSDIFVAKYSPSGTGIWAARFGGAGDDQARAIAVDRNGDVLVTGYFSLSCAFGANSYTALGTTDAFVLKLSGANGSVLWSKQIGGQYGSGNLNNSGFGIVAATNGDVIATGVVAGWVDFGAGLNYSYSLDPNTFLIRYSSTGQYQWAKEFTCSSADMGKSVALDASGNIYLAGVTQGPIDLGGGVLPQTSTPNAAYLARFTSAGAHVWSKTFNAALGVNANAMSLDSNGNIALTGSFNGTIDFGNGSLQSNGQSGYVVKLSSSNGSAIWSKAIVGNIYYLYGTSSASGVGVTTDASGNVIVTGQFWEKCNFGGGDLIVPSVGTGDGFLAKYSAASGAYMSALQFGGTGNDWGTSVVVNGGNTVVAGTTQGGNFNGTTLTSQGGYDAFIMKLAF
jgi:hypothetical protein